MKRSKRRWKFLAAALALVLILVLVASWWVRRPWPQVEGNLIVAGLEAPVEVIRDRWGVPHIYAESKHDLFFAQGFVHAQDRLWQMEFSRRAGSGALSAFLGEDLLEFDRFFRAVGLRRASEGEWQRMDAESRQLLEDYADGVNSYLESHRGRLALEFDVLGIDPEPWSPVDVLVTVKALYWILAENLAFELDRAFFLSKVGEEVMQSLLPPYSDGAPMILPPGTEGYTWLETSGPDIFEKLAPILGTPGPNQGSNNWVIHGDRTQSGRPILANDTHLELFMPSAWYAIGLHGGGYDVVGFSLAGAPAVILGHNQRIAWGVSDLVPDIQDVYLEKLDDPENPTRYEFMGEWRDLEVIEETLEVKDGEPETLRLFKTHHGLLLNDFLDRIGDSEPMSFAWTGTEGQTLIRSIDLINRAEDWEQFRQAVSYWDGPHMSFVYADVDGNIGYQASGLIPVRAPGHSGAVPVPGWTGEYEWQGYIPFEELPWHFNPEQGFFATANHKIVSDDYPYSLGYEFADPYRAERINQLLAAEDRATLETSKTIQGDTYHLPGEALRPHLLAVEPQNDLEARVLEQIEAWNLRADPDQTGAMIYQVWYRFLLTNTVEDELGENLMQEYLASYWVHGPVMVGLMGEGTSSLFDDTETPEVETQSDIVARSLRDAITWLSERLGDDPAEWRWGRLHTLTFRHRPIGFSGIPPLERLVNGATVPSPGGDRFTVNAAWFTVFDPENPFAADAGAAQRLIIDVGDWDNCLAVNSTGQSEHLFHPNRRDQIPLWRDLEFHNLPFSRAAVEAAGKYVLSLTPADATVR